MNKIEIYPSSYNVPYGVGYEYGQRVVINGEVIEWDSQINIALFKKLLMALNVEYDLEHFDESY